MSTLTPQRKGKIARLWSSSWMARLIVTTTIIVMVAGLLWFGLSGQRTW